MSPSSTVISSPVQELAPVSYDQSLTGRQRHRARLARKRRIAAYARLVMAVAEARRLSEAEVRDLMRVQPDDPAAFRLMRGLDAAGLVAPVAMDGSPWTRPVTVDEDGTVVSGHHRAALARQLDLPLAETNGRDAP